MIIVTRRHLERAVARYKDAANELKAWAVVVDKVRWRNFSEVRASFPDADTARGYVVFNVGHNRYRLITHIHYAKDDPKKRFDPRPLLHSLIPHPRRVQHPSQLG